MLSIGLDIIQELYADNTALLILVKFTIQLCGILKICITILTVYIQKNKCITQKKSRMHIKLKRQTMIRNNTIISNIPCSKSNGERSTNTH